MEIKKLIHGVAINDLHFGIKESKRVYEELIQFKDYLQNNPDIQFCIIDGDYFQCKLSISDPASYIAISFFKELSDICKKQHIKLRIVHGTKSHDMFQIDIFQPFTTDIDLDMRIIKTVEEEDLCGLHVLYLPEEYPMNVEEYYAPYKATDKRYNCIFGHGTWDFVAQQGLEEKSNNNETHTAPVFMWKEWKHTVPNGFISFGHIHGRNVYSNKIYYSGAFSIWNYVESDKVGRGFTDITYNLSDLTYDVHFVDNTMAPKFETLALSDIDIDIDTDPMETVISKMKTKIESVNEHNDNVRFILRDVAAEKVKLIKDVFNREPNVKFECKVAKSSILKESSDRKNFKKYEYLTKKTMPLAESIQKFCKEDMDYNISIEKINEVLTDNG